MSSYRHLEYLSRDVVYKTESISKGIMAPFSYYPRHKSTEAMHKKGIGIGKEREMKGKRKIYRPRWNIQEKGNGKQGK